MVRSACCDQQEHIKKGAWTKDEDERLISYIKQHGEGSWKSLPKAAGLLRCGKSCRLRWINYLRPDVKRGNFTREEDELIINLQRVIGNKWSLIAARLPGRTDNEIKNHWNTHIKRRLQQRRTCQQPQRENHIGTTMPVYPQHPQQPLPFLMPSGHDIVKFPTVQNCFSTVSNTHDNSVSEFSSSSNSTIAYSDQVTEPAINLELSMSLPLQSDDAMKINDKFKIEKKWELHYPQLFGKSLAASSLSGSIRPAAKESLCLCNSLARGQNNGDKATCSSCTKCASMSRGNADPAANMFYRPMSL